MSTRMCPAPVADSFPRSSGYIKGSGVFGLWEARIGVIWSHLKPSSRRVPLIGNDSRLPHELETIAAS